MTSDYFVLAEAKQEIESIRSELESEVRWETSRVYKNCAHAACNIATTAIDTLQKSDGDRKVAIDTARYLYQLIGKALDADSGHGILPQELHDIHFVATAQCKWLTEPRESQKSWDIHREDDEDEEIDFIS